MKLSKLFHWLYASLMFLPLLVIPIFAIFTRNESNTFENNIELQVQQNKVVDFNQLIPTNFYKSTVEKDGVTITNNNDGSVAVNGVYTPSRSTTDIGINTTTIPLTIGHTYIWGGYNSNEGNNYYLITYINNYTSNINTTDGFVRITCNSASNFILTLRCLDNYQFNNVVFYPMLFDLTQMFGSGNEPTLNVFFNWYNDTYYSYNVSEKQLLKTGIYETLNNTDIGSQFLYSVYKPVNDYFNIKDWMNLGGIYDWFLLYIFNGSNSIVIPIIFNLIIYWLVVSFIWLIFDVLMYVPNMIHKMLDKARLE